MHYDPVFVVAAFAAVQTYLDAVGGWPDGEEVARALSSIEGAQEYARKELREARLLVESPYAERDPRIRDLRLRGLVEAERLVDATGAL